MNLSCSSRMIKYLMFGFNLFFVISGIIVIAVGATVKTVYTEYEEFLETDYFTLPNMLIATGVFIFLISFFGCCGAIKESWIMLGIFSILLCIIFIFEFASGIAGYVLRDKTAHYLEQNLRRNLDTYNHTHQIWDAIQDTFQCCGVDSYLDWRGKLGNDTFALPISCCPAVSGVTNVFYCNSYSPPATTPTPEVRRKRDLSNGMMLNGGENGKPEVTTDSPTKPTDPPAKTTVKPTEPPKPDTELPSPTPVGPSTAHPYTTGCKSAFGNYVRKHALQIGGWALGLAIIQIMGIVFSCHLVRQLKNGYYST